MTLLELRNLALDWLDDPNGTYFTPTIMNRRLNLALKELQKDLIAANKQYYAKCVETDFVVNQGLYALPSDYIQTIRLERYNPNSGQGTYYDQIMPMTPNQQNMVSGQLGMPTNYYFQKNNIVLRPTPNQTYTMRLTYSYVVQDMVLDADVPDAPLIYHEFIAILCARDGFIKDDRPLGPIDEKMEVYRRLLKQTAEQRNADMTRMVTLTNEGYGMGF